MTIQQQVVNGLQQNDLLVVKELLDVDPAGVKTAIVSVVSGLESGSRERYNAFLAMGFCKKTGRGDFPVHAEEIYDAFIGSL